MNFKKPAFLFFFIASCFTSAFAQRDTVGLTTILDKTTKYAAAFPIEKVYLHFDKPYYAATDTIWFKAYVTIEKHLPSALSKIVYIDIANSQDTIVKEVKLSVVNGFAMGSIVLTPGAYPEGNYHLRAYTGWMRNSDPEYFFNKNLVIGNPVDNAVSTNISFNTAMVNKRIRINASISYKDPGEAPLANKKITWTATAVNGDELGKGKGNTDANGLFNLDFTGDNASVLQSAILTTIIDTGSRKPVLKMFPLKTAAGIKDVQFFPEGGDLLVGVRSKVAFKAIGTNGLGLNVKGNITDNTGAEVAAISTQHLGMGVFALSPEDGKSYKANITFADGTKTTYDLPRIRPAGITMALFNTDPATVTLKISANAPYFTNNQNKQYYIIAQTGGTILFAAQTKLDAAVYSSAIQKSKFPTGIVQFTLFTATGVPVSERIVFIQNNDAMNLTVTADKKIYNTRQNVKMVVNAKSKTLPVMGNFSVAVIDEGKVPFDENNETTILSNLLLSSELKGYVEKPNYYFLAKNTNAADDLDVLMLTQGYRRISYSNILVGKYPQIYLYPEQQGLEISGILRTNTGMPVSKGNLLLQMPGKASEETYTDMVGNFKFSKLTFKDSAQVTITARNNPLSKNMAVSINGESYQPASKNNYVYDEIPNIDSTFKPYLANSKKVYDSQHILKEVVIKATVYKKPLHRDWPGLTGLPTIPDQTVGAEVFKGCPSLFNCLPSMVLGITADNGLFYFIRNYNSSDKLPIQIYLDGKPVDATALSTVRGDDVESVEVYKTDGFSGANKQTGTAGLILVNMRKINKTKISFAQMQDLIPKPYEVTYTANGFAVTKEFYSPRYLVGKPMGGPDLRSTIYWNPKVLTDKTGAATFDFFNADGRGTYRATIEGIDADGNLGRYVLRYTVK
ncbi:carboxypeptidase regulatory-like domain-containing protein [Mucilaginibacter glaciei]|uniref:Carboxypeptidase regulatory-like domain-containing protein n=1 Tax=Mucilaginibacter glaciei TaxID=2772109 RepID=A0A926NPM8_9SPHI|nr:carboxypeptidase regulatory-like domain-containing protein [Mucilaginibacter glaciei]MBD1395016.1 carboxypeptidase regulatory-like domain-containing protein [Mucilaginibacter glaciei]